MSVKVLIIGPKSPPFGGMANQCRLLVECFERENVKVFFVATNQAPSIFNQRLWELPVFRTLGKFSVYLAGLIKGVKHCSILHILACSHMYFYLNVIPAIFIGRFLNKRVIVNYRGGEAEKFFQGAARFFLWVFHFADALVVPSQYLQTIFHKLGYTPIIIPNISELDRFHFRIPDYSRNIQFLCTRNFELYYDVMTLVKAFKKVKKKLPGASLILIGEGSLKHIIADYVRENNLTESIVFQGRVDPDDMPLYLEKNDIFVNSSVVDNYPISLLEAFSIGLPVISTASGGIPYMIEHGKSGILVPPEDHMTLAKEMILLAQDLNLGRKLALNARKFADEHSWEKIWPKLKAEYN